MRPTCLASSLLVIACVGQSHATEQPAALANGQFGATFSTVEAAGSSNKSAQADVRLTVPVTALLGASLRGNLAESNIQIDLPTDLPGTLACNYQTLGATGTLFARRPTVGRVSASISTTRLESKCGSSAMFTSGDGDSLRSTGYSLAAEYYFPRLTLAAERTVAYFDEEGDRATELLSAHWYPLPDLSIAPGIGRIDGRTQFELGVEIQPDFLGRGASVSLSVSELALENDPVRTINFSFNYHFGARVDLKTRDRQYR